MKNDSKRIVVASILIFIVLLLQPYYLKWLGVEISKDTEKYLSGRPGSMTERSLDVAIEVFNKIIARANNNDIHIFKLGSSFKNIAVNNPNVKVAVPNPNGLIAQ